MQNRNRILTAEVILTLLVLAAAPATSASALQPQTTAAQDAAQPQQKPDAAQPTPAPPDQSKAVVVTGTIVKNDSGFVLKDSKGTVYQLDAQDKAAPFENKSVKVTGKLEQAQSQSQIAVLHVDAIEPMTA